MKQIINRYLAQYKIEKLFGFALMRCCLFSTLLVFTTLPVWSQINNFTPVTKEMLAHPSPDDWLMFSRTYDNQRYSPLDQINRENASQLRTAWVRGLGPGVHENIPIVYRGVMYVLSPGVAGRDATSIQALDATNGDLIWEYMREFPDDLVNFAGTLRNSKTLAIFHDLIYYSTPDGYLVALDARTGELRWETEVFNYKNGARQNAGVIVVDGKVMTGRNCSRPGRPGCFISAHDALTGKEVWKFYNTAAPGEQGGDTWGGLEEDKRAAGAWGLPGAYDPVRHLVL